MDIRRAIPIVHSHDLDASKTFYVEFLGFEVAMEQQGFLMLRSKSQPTTQVIVATEDAHDPQVRLANMSVEVNDVDFAYQRARESGLEIIYGIADEPWGVRRFFVRDPNGAVINVAMHIPT